MTDINIIKSNIIETIKYAQVNETYHEDLFNDDSVKGKNEFLCFIKPELTMRSETIRLTDILNLIFGKIDEFGLSVKNIKVLSAKYLEQYNIIAEHYGVINKLSNNPLAEMTDGAKERFKEAYGNNIEDEVVLGSLEFLKTVDGFTPTSLDYFWQNGEYEKLAGGTYSYKALIDNNPVYLINGFHPRQLEHFTEEGRCIVTMTLAGDLDWDKARTNFIGSTNPANAVEGSIRKDLFDNKRNYGLPRISDSWNGVHLSAGPIEGLIELIRYNSDFSKNNIKTYNDFDLGRHLDENFNTAQIKSILSNGFVETEGQSISIFDITEEKNSDEALKILKDVL